MQEFFYGFPLGKCWIIYPLSAEIINGSGKYFGMLDTEKQEQALKKLERWEHENECGILENKIGTIL